MKKFISLIIIACITAGLSSCKKEGPNIFNMFTDVKVEFSNADPHNIVDTKTVNVGDEVWIDYTVTSAKEDMYFIDLLEVGGDTQTPVKYPLDASMRRVATGHIVIKPNRTGQITYRLFAADKTGYYLGDGYKTLTLNVVNDFTFVTERYVDMPNPFYRIDSAKVPSTTDNYKFTYPTPDGSVGDYTTSAQSFFSIGDAKAYNYADATANSAKVDFGIYFKPTVTITKNATTGAVTIAPVPHYYIYATGVSPSPLPTAGTEGPTGFEKFTFTGWTAKGTVFSAAQANSVFTAMKTGQQIADGAAKVAVNLTNPELVNGSAYYFKTATGKYGMIWAHDYGADRLHARPYVNFWVKMQL